MITSLEVDGFKTLTNFRISFQPGLNVLIGPNGAGKTNICQALGLLSATASGDITSYAVHLGGSRSLFSMIEREKHSKPQIRLKCTGKFREQSNHMDLFYSYQFGINLLPQIGISNELFVLHKVNPETKRRYILMRVSKAASTSNVKFEIPKPKEAGPLAFPESKAKRGATYSLKIRRRGDIPILPVIGDLSFFCFQGVEDMRQWTPWNIDPYVAKRPSDVLESAIMLPDGRHLANAINEMRKKPAKFSEIDAILSRIIPQYTAIEPQDINEQQSRTFVVKTSQGLSFQASSLSDGTIKLIALLIGLTQRPHTTAVIEEPENYLHPWISQTLIGYLRENYVGSNCILTTHSETVLNHVSPSEIVVIENHEGHTKQIRLDSDPTLSKAIIDSGFGCGYHYISGSLGGTP